MAGAISFFFMYLAGADYLAMQALFLVGLLALAWRRDQHPNNSMDLAFTGCFAAAHLYQWGLLFFLGANISLRLDILGLVVLDLFLISQNLLKTGRFQELKLLPLTVYALGMHVGMATLAYTYPASTLIPGFAFLAWSILALETGRAAPKWPKFSHEAAQQVQESFIQVGILFLFASLCCYVTVHMQAEMLSGWIPLRMMAEGLSLLSVGYWLLYPVQNDHFSRFTKTAFNALLEVVLALSTLTIFVEMPDMWRPLCWGAMALGLAFGTMRFSWPRRLFSYTWIYLIASVGHTTFVTSTLTMPLNSFLESYYIPVILALATQFAFAFLAHHKQEAICASAPKGMTTWIYRHPALGVMLPIFAGIGAMLAFNFEREILTLLWV
ncbi:MAG: hypothetical protein LLG04_15630, partial [Parachlamydia sp.]|nr:hypothetical protein [Parachlamydia sp.]